MKGILHVNNFKMRCEKKVSKGKRSGLGNITMSVDRHVFNLLTVLGLVFMTLYLVGTSLPGWFVIDEHVNTSSCASAHTFLSTHVQGSKDAKYSGLYISSSLWYLLVRVDGKVPSTINFLPFVILSKSEGDTPNVLCSGLLGIITFTLLALGVVFTMSASAKPSKMIYYGLSQISIVTAASTWMLVSFEASQSYVKSIARDFCLEYVVLSTSLSLQILTGACAVLAFIMGCLLIHIATIFYSNLKGECHSKCYDVISEQPIEDHHNDDDMLLDI